MELNEKLEDLTSKLGPLEQVRIFKYRLSLYGPADSNIFWQKASNGDRSMTFSELTGNNFV